MSVVLLCRFAEILRCDFLTRMRQTTVFVLVFIQMLRLQVITKQTRNIKLINKKKYRGTLGFVVCLFVFLGFFQNGSFTLLQKLGLSSNGKRNILLRWP